MEDIMGKDSSIDCKLTKKAMGTIHTKINKNPKTLMPILVMPSLYCIEYLYSSLIKYLNQRMWLTTVMAKEPMVGRETGVTNGKVVRRER